MASKQEGKAAKKEETADSAPVEKKSKGRGKAKGTRHHVHHWSTYIYKVLKQVHGTKEGGKPNIGISTRAMSIMSSIANDMRERLAMEAGRLARYNKKQTLSDREIQTAVRLILPKELATHAVSDGTKAVTKYTTSRG